MKPPQEVAALSLCRKLNTRFGPPRNPAWEWCRAKDVMDGKVYTLVLPCGSDSLNLSVIWTVPAWTIADLLCLFRQNDKMLGWDLMDEMMTASKLAAFVLECAEEAEE